MSLKPMCSDKKFCGDYKSEGTTRHMSSQGMLEQLVNSIIEGPLKKSCKTKFFCYQISNFYSFVNSMRNNKDLIKSVLPCLSTASLKDPLHEKPCKIMKNYVFQKVIMTNLYRHVILCRLQI